MKRLLPVLAVLLVVAGVGCGGHSPPPSKRATAALSEATPSVTLVNQPWLCNSPVDIDTVQVTLNPSYTGTTLAAIKTGPNCTGRVGRVVVLTGVEDGIKVSGSHDLTIGGGIVDCYDHLANAHQDGTQVLAGVNITYRNVVFACHSANNSGFYLSPVNGPITNVVCDGCWLGGTGSSSAFVSDQATGSGVRNSTVCPSSFFAYRHNLALDEGNTYPATC